MNVSEMTGTKMLNPMYSIATDGIIAYAEQIIDGNKFQTQYNKKIKKAIKMAKAAM